MKNLDIRAYGHTEFALLYLSTCTRLIAYRKLQYCIDCDPGLRQLLKDKSSTRK
ncbi:hypothetical protein EVA_03591 [gut metagenome]|uniref:Uncharacterized protein n=1 Tax=gut metagenome TaxID=749906 RepID=J9D6C2_9ZZZZ